MNRRTSIRLLGLFGVGAIIPFNTLAKLAQKSMQDCKNEWVRLSRLNAVRYQFRYIQPEVELPNVFIYGDSISIGYTEYVRASLQGKANVMRLHVNGGSSNQFIQKIETFRKALFQPFFKDGWSFSWDVIHFNVGLHDLKYVHDGKLDKEKGTQISTRAEYAQNLTNIILHLKKNYPNATLIFATTTPVPAHAEGRVEGDALKYNETALAVLKKYPEVVVNDLYTYSIPLQKKYADGEGNVHYKPEGYREQGILVASKIADALQVNPVSCPSSEVIVKRAKQYEAKHKQ